MKKNKNRLLENRKLVFLLAVVMAAISWIIIAGFINPGDSKRIEFVKIDYERYAQQYQTKNLQIVGTPSVTYVDLMVQGDGSVIGALNAGAFLAYVDYSGVTGPGTVDVPVYVEQRTTTSNYTITSFTTRESGHSLESSPKAYVTLTFEEIESKEFPVTVKAEGVTAASGFFAENPVSSPATVMITGPKTAVEQIATVEAEVTALDELSATTTYPGIELELLNESGNPLDTEALDLSLATASVEVTVNILEIRTVPLSVEFTGLPQYFDTEWFYSRVHLSDDELQVVGSTEAFANLSQIVAATFDISDLTMGWESDPIDITLPDGLTNHDQLRQITVSFDTTDLVAKTFEVPIDSDNVVNPPVSATISPVADTISVALLGPEEQIGELLPEDISVQIDAFSIKATGGAQQQIPVRVRVPGANQAIITGKYSVVCNVTVE